MEQQHEVLARGLIPVSVIVLHDEDGSVRPYRFQFPSGQIVKIKKIEREETVNRVFIADSPKHGIRYVCAIEEKIGYMVKSRQIDLLMHPETVKNKYTPIKSGGIRMKWFVLERDFPRMG